MNNNILIPKRLQVETFYGCNARCTMCALSHPGVRKKGIMPQDMFQHIFDSMAHLSDKIDKVDLFTMGEPLLDTLIFQRIKYVRGKGFRNLSISTNADLLDAGKQEQLLDTSIETVIFSIDGVRKETHEAIRRGVNFERVRDNCLNFIRKRNKGKFRTKIIIRFIKQKNNIREWNDFREFWGQQLNPELGDRIILYNLNTMGGLMFDKKRIMKGRLDRQIEEIPCHQVFDRLIVLSNGIVPLCCEDSPNADYKMGDVKESAPIDIFNNLHFKRIREIHSNKGKNALPICNKCTILYSEKELKIINV